MLIAIIFDVSEQIDDFIKREAPLKGILVDYYLNFILFYGNLFSPLLIFIAVIFFTSKMASNSEIVAILSAGISFKRVLVPYLIAATLLASISLYLNHWLLPKANESRIAFEDTYLRYKFRNHNKNIHKQIAPDEFLSSRVLIQIDKQALKFLSKNGKMEKWFKNLWAILPVGIAPLINGLFRITRLEK